MNESIEKSTFKWVLHYIDNLISPRKEIQGTEDYYRTKTFNSFTFISVVISFLNGVYRFIQIITGKSNATFFITNAIIFITVLILFFFGKSKYYYIGILIFPIIPLLAIWTFYFSYKSNPNVELLIVNPTFILVLGLIVGGLILSLREYLLLCLLSISDLLLFYGFALDLPNEWIIPRLVIIILVSAFMTFSTIFRLISYRYLNETNRKLTQEVEIKQKNLIDERLILYSLIANLKEGVVIIDQSNVPIIVNNKFITMYREITGNIFDLNEKITLNLTSSNPFEKFLNNIFNDSYKSEVLEIDKKFYLLIGNHIKPNLDSNNLGYMIEIHDITSLKTVDMLEKNFRKVIMHELRTPTTSLHLSISNLVKYWDKLSDSDRNRLLNSLMTQTNKFTDIIQKISTLTDLEDNRPLNLTDIDFISFLNNFNREFIKDNNSHQILVENSINNNFVLSIDEPLILQSLSAIIDNARKFSDKNSSIEVKFSIKNEKFLNIQIIDHGIGIDEKEIPFVFNKFYKGKIAENYPGEGLGLSIAYEILMLHNGKITIKSKLDSGTTIDIILPFLNKSQD